MERRVTFNKILGIIFMVCASFILYVGLMIGPMANIIAGCIFLIVSILFLLNPALVYDEQQIRIKNLFGMTLKSYTFESDNITTKGRDIFANGKKLNVARRLLARSDYDDLIQFILTKQIEQKNEDNKRD